MQTWIERQVKGEEKNQNTYSAGHSIQSNSNCLVAWRQMFKEVKKKSELHYWRIKPVTVTGDGKMCTECIGTDWRHSNLWCLVEMMKRQAWNKHEIRNKNWVQQCEEVTWSNMMSQFSYRTVKVISNDIKKQLQKKCFHTGKISTQQAGNTAPHEHN